MAEKMCSGIPVKLCVLPEGRLRLSLNYDGGGSDQFITAIGTPPMVIDRMAIILAAAVANARHISMGYQTSDDGWHPVWIEMGELPV